MDELKLTGTPFSTTYKRTTSRPMDLLRYLRRKKLHTYMLKMPIKYMCLIPDKLYQ